jgi:2-keto-4-pentenoate hydratase/2-oxohepta-3-ene-1,7-dioic acid hydratase in catechol pathway
MKLARFDAGRGPRLGLVTNDGILDLHCAGLGYSTMIELIGGGAAALAAVRKVSGYAVHHHLSDVRLLAPVERPGKYLAIGMNYGLHAAEAEELGIAAQAHQLWFNKQTSCINDPYGDIVRGVTEKLDYEVELGVVIGRTAKAVAAEDALAHVFGYFVANDVSARDWQFHSPTFTVGKSFDSHGPIGPWIVTADEVGDPHALRLNCFVNGEMRQSSNTSQMVHRIERQIEYLSTAFTLEPGDLIATGTPEGIGASMKPPRFLQPGDVVRCEIERVGVIESRVRA